MNERVRERAGRPALALAADSLTAGRLPLAIVLLLVLGLGDSLAWGAVLLALAWVTDFADGRLARLAGTGTRLGAWDPIADAAIGLGVLTGLAAAERIGVFPWLVLGILLVAGFFATHNLALGMVAQAVAYGLFIIELAIDAPGMLWVIGVTAAMIAVADARRLVEVVLPTFFSGLGLARSESTGRDPRAS